MKKFLVCLNMMCVIFCLSVCAQAKDIYGSYIDVITRYDHYDETSVSSIYYFIYDIDKDGTPELIINDQTLPSASDIYVYTYKNNEATYVGEHWGGRVRFYTHPGNGFAVSYTMDGVGTMEQISIVNGQLRITQEWDVWGGNELELLPYGSKELNGSGWWSNNFSIDYAYINNAIASQYTEEYACWYSTSGLMAPNTSGWSAISDPGAMVYADHSIFNKKEVTVMNYPVAEYSVYSSTTGSETLTLGVVESNDNIDHVVMNHINYIERTGGIMTGYSVDSDGRHNRCINISWDVAGMHHYARFEYEVSPSRVGYYDLMFTDYRSFDIGAMNRSFGVLGEYQR